MFLLLNLSMNKVLNIPTALGQICKIIAPVDDEDPNDVYIVSEHPTPFDLEDTIYLTNPKDLQRDIYNPLITPQIAVNKGDLTVIAENLKDYADYVTSLNKK